MPSQPQPATPAWQRALLQAFAGILIAGCTQPQATPPREATGALPDFVQLVKQQGPAVVNVSSIRRAGRGTPGPDGPVAVDDLVRELLRHFGLNSAGEGEPGRRSLGSGFIIDQRGYILTNAHVVENADEVTVGLIDKREFKATVVGVDTHSDVALLRIPADQLPVVRIGDPSRLEVGEWVVAIGAPFGFSNSVTQGIISAKGRDLPSESVIIPFIQTDVAINPGSSGGPLFNLRGEVVGINSQIYSHSGGAMGISFAVPIDLAMKIKEQLLVYGKVRRGKLGVTIQEVTPELARSFGLPKVSGALVAGLEHGGPAGRAGIRTGDVVMAVDGTEVSGVPDLFRRIAEVAPGTRIRVKVWRDGALREFGVILGEVGVTSGAMPESGSIDRRGEVYGMTLRELTRAERYLFQTDGTVIVDAVEGLAALAGIRPDDIILAVNNHPVQGIEQLGSEIDKAGKSVALLIQRDPNAILFIALGS